MKKIILVSAILMLVLAGCDENRPEPAAPSSTGKGAVAEIEKWNTYVDLGIYLDTDFSPAMDEYFRTMGLGRGQASPDRTEYIADLLSQMVDNKQLSHELELALAKAAHFDGDLDQTTYEMSVQLKEVWAELARARDYYVAGEYESDNYAQAKEVHQRIYEAYMALESTHSRFRDILVKEDVQRRKKDIEAMSAQGLVVRPAMLKVIDDGQALQDLLGKFNLSSGGLAAMKAEDVQPLSRALAQSVAALKEALGQAAPKDLEGLKGKDLADFSFQAEDLSRVALNLGGPYHFSGNINGGGTDISHSEIAEHYNQSLGKLIDIYNSLVPSK